MVLHVGARTNNKIVPINNLPVITDWVDYSSDLNTRKPANLPGNYDIARYRRNGDVLEGEVLYKVSAAGSGTTLQLAIVPTGLSYYDGTSYQLMNSSGYLIKAGSSTASVFRGLLVWTNGTALVSSHSRNTFDYGADYTLANDVIHVNFSFKVAEWANSGVSEGVDAGIYIPNASPSETGLITAVDQSLAGVKTFNDGIKPSSASDILGEYKTGTFTPTLSIGTNITAVENIYSKYTRIGNLVYCSCEMKVALSGSGASQFTFLISDLPAAPYDGDMVLGNIGIRGAVGSTAGTVWGFSSTTIYCSFTSAYTGERYCVLNFSYMTS